MTTSVLDISTTNTSVTYTSVGDKVRHYRTKKGWTVIQFIEKLGGNISPSYVTRIEVYGEIPSPELIQKIAKVFKIDKKELIELAKKEKVEQFETSFDKKYK